MDFAVQHYLPAWVYLHATILSWKVRLKINSFAIIGSHVPSTSFQSAGCMYDKLFSKPFGWNRNTRVSKLQDPHSRISFGMVTLFVGTAVGYTYIQYIHIYINAAGCRSLRVGVRETMVNYGYINLLSLGTRPIVLGNTSQIRLE